MKFKNYIETESGIKDTSTSPGTAGQVLSSTVTGTSWIDQGEIIAAAATVVVIECKNTHTTALTKGTPVYQTGTVGATDVIEIAPGDALISTGAQPSIGLLQQDLAINQFGYVIITGELLNITTDPIDGLTPVTGQKIFVKSGGGLTLTKPTTQLNSIQNMGLVGKVSGGNAGSITVSSIMRTNDVPNLPTGKIWVGDGNTIVSDTVYLDEVNNELGINTINPLAKLQVNTGSDVNAQVGLDQFGSFKLGDVLGNYANRGIFYDSSTPGSENMEIRSDIFRISGAGGEGIQQVSNGDIYLNASQGILATLDASTNNFGIGTTTPALKLEVEGGDGLLQLSTTSSTGSPFLSFNQAGARRSFIQHTDSGDTLKLASEYGGISFFTGTGGTETEKMTILSNGDVGIGATNPITKLEINGPNHDANFTSGCLMIKQASTGSRIFIDGNDIDSADGILFLNDYSLNAVRLGGDLQVPNGDIGIGFTTAPTQRLHVDGNVRVTGDYYDSNNSAGTTGQVLSSTAAGTDWVLVSDLPIDTRYVAVAGDTMTGTLDINRSGSGQIRVNNQAIFGTHYTSTDVWIYGQNAGSSIFLGGGIGNIQNDVKIQNGDLIVSNGNAGIGTTSPQAKLDVNGGVRIANDTAAASATNVGTLRYRTSGNNSYVDMVMQTGAATYAWVNIVQNTW